MAEVAQECCIACKLKYMWCLLTARWHWQRIYRSARRDRGRHLDTCLTASHLAIVMSKGNVTEAVDVTGGMWSRFSLACRRIWACACCRVACWREC